MKTSVASKVQAFRHGHGLPAVALPWLGSARAGEHNGMVVSEMLMLPFEQTRVERGGCVRQHIQQGLPEGASRTASQVGNASFRLANALCEVVSVVFCDKIVRTYAVTPIVDDFHLQLQESPVECSAINGNHLLPCEMDSVENLQLAILPATGPMVSLGICMLHLAGIFNDSREGPCPCVKGAHESVCGPCWHATAMMHI